MANSQTQLTKTWSSWDKWIRLLVKWTNTICTPGMNTTHTSHSLSNRCSPSTRGKYIVFISRYNRDRARTLPREVIVCCLLYRRKMRSKQGRQRMFSICSMSMTRMAIYTNRNRQVTSMTIGLAPITITIVRTWQSTILYRITSFTRKILVIEPFIRRVRLRDWIKK